MDIIEAIKVRHSVRSYSGIPLTETQRHELTVAIDKSFSPFGGKTAIRLRHFDIKSDYKPSTYGTIRNACDFLLMSIADGEDSALSAGFRMEQIILKATQMGLGTCWIAATFKGSDFDKDENREEGMNLKIISPVGIAAQKKSLFERLARYALGSEKRKPFRELFFTDSFRSPLSDKSYFAESLQMLRLAPSSTNSQPWRALVDGSTVHFYYKPKGEWSILDCGIALYHFYAVEQSKGHEGVFFKTDCAVTNSKGYKYITSYRV